MTREQFDLSIARLTMLRGTPENADHFFGAVEEIPADLFELACQRSLRTRVWFPTPAEIRVDVDASARLHKPELEPEPAVIPGGKTHHIPNPFGGKGITVHVDRDWRNDCDLCGDTGRRSWWCGAASGRYPDMPIRHCERRGEHYAHEWIDRCDCADWNPTIKRRKAAMEKHYSETPSAPR